MKKYLSSVLFLTGGVIGCVYVDESQEVFLAYAILGLFTAPVMMIGTAFIELDKIKTVSKFRLSWLKSINFIWLMMWGFIIYRGYFWTGLLGYLGCVASLMFIGVLEKKIREKSK